jgi:hypothetical protein
MKRFEVIGQKVWGHIKTHWVKAVKSGSPSLVNNIVEVRDIYSAQLEQLLAKAKQETLNALEVCTLIELTKNLDHLEKALLGSVDRYFLQQELLPGLQVEASEGRRLRPEQVKPLEEWVARNRNDLYPSQEEKLLLCQASGLTFKQLTNWFINKRMKLDCHSRRQRKHSDLEK